MTSYPLVTLFDSTPYVAWGKVSYASAFCRDDNYSVTPQTQWKASSRGVCLVTKISATVRTPQGDIVAESYTSSGTSYSTFIIVQTGPTAFAVTRKVT